MPQTANRDLKIHLMLLVAVTACGPVSSAEPGAAGPTAEYAGVARMLERFIGHEMANKGLPAVSIALVDDQKVVWSRGFGFANPADSSPASAATIYRVGSVSKLFTDIAVMQLVEKGELDLDAPITTYLPDFTPGNPSGKPITLRQLTSHRAGLQREPPLGNYFDATSPSLGATVASLAKTSLVYPPGTRIKYSNAGIAVVGYALERKQGELFARYVKRSVLDPIGMTSSTFEADSGINRAMAHAVMWTYDGRVFPAPTFPLGMAPAGSLYTSVDDLARFLSVLFAGGKTGGGQLLKRETLEAMWTPQFAPAGQKTGYGIGFAISELEGHRRVGHSGSIYGFATELSALPDDKLGVVVAASKDVANTITERIADAALSAMLAARGKRPLPEPVTTTPVPRQRARALVGRYVSAHQKGAAPVDLVELDGTLRLARVDGEFSPVLRMRGDTLVTDDLLSFGARIVPLNDRLVIESDTLVRAPAPVPRPGPPPAKWDGLIGEYGWDHNTLYIREAAGHLDALIEWFFDYPLTQVSDSVFAFPASGLYDGERLTFRRDRTGRATQVAIGAVVFPRRAMGAEDGSTFKITPLRPADVLTQEALKARPPVEAGDFRKPDLVELNAVDPTIKLDMRYATTNNFVSTAFYREARAFMQRPAAEAAARANRRLKAAGYGLLIHDSYRPWYVTRMFWDATPDSLKMFVANPQRGSRHNRGCAVDLTLYDLATGRPVRMVGGYDEMSPRAFPAYPGGTSQQRWLRELLRGAMEAEGFTVNDVEWWHFDYQDWQKYPILNLRFEDIAR